MIVQTRLVQRAVREPRLFADVAWMCSRPRGWEGRGADWARRLGARYEVIADAGHLPNLDQPERTAELLNDFWKGVGRTAL